MVYSAREHYEIETQLADRLRAASRADRGELYANIYDELFRRVPEHPQLRRKEDRRISAVAVSRQLGLLGRFLSPATTFLEIGPGDCALSFAVAKTVHMVYGADVSARIVKNSDPPANFALILSDGCGIPLPDASVDIVYSNQLIEHLHPEDFVDHLARVHAVIRPGGAYVCITPNRLNGPHDISRAFDVVARGLHLREYCFTELSEMFEAAGFVRLGTYVGGKGHYFPFPLAALRTLEWCLERLPPRLGKSVANLPLIRAALNIRLVARK